MKTFIKFVYLMVIATALLACSKEKPIRNLDNMVETEKPTVSFDTQNNRTVAFHKEFLHPTVVSFWVRNWQDGYTISVSEPEAVSAELQFDTEIAEGSLSLMFTKKDATQQVVKVIIKNNKDQIITEAKLNCIIAYMSVHPESFDFTDSPQNTNFIVNTNFKYTAESDSEWVKVSSDNDNVWLKVEQNPLETNRTANILLKNRFGDVFCSIPVKQNGCANPVMYLSDRELLRRIGQKFIDGGSTDPFFYECLSDKTLKELRDWAYPGIYSTANTMCYIEIKDEYVTSLNISVDLTEPGKDTYVGTLPEEIGYLKKLKGMGIGNLHNLKSPVPASFKYLENCIDIMIDDTGMDGPIPDVFNEMPKLRILYLTGNKFTGNFPMWLKDKDETFVFWAVGNRLSGQIPDEITHAAWWIPGRGFEQHFTDGAAGQRYPYKIWTSDFANEDPWYNSPILNHIFVNEPPMYSWLQFKESEMENWGDVITLADEGEF